MGVRIWPGIVHASVLCACLRTALRMCLRPACVCGFVATSGACIMFLPTKRHMPTGLAGREGGLGAAVQGRFGAPWPEPFLSLTLGAQRSLSTATSDGRLCATEHAPGNL